MKMKKYLLMSLVVLMVLGSTPTPASPHNGSDNNIIGSSTEGNQGNTQQSENSNRKEG